MSKNSAESAAVHRSSLLSRGSVRTRIVVLIVMFSTFAAGLGTFAVVQMNAMKTEAAKMAQTQTTVATDLTALKDSLWTLRIAITVLGAYEADGKAAQSAKIKDASVAFDAAASACDVAAADLEVAGVDVRESAPAVEGTRVDAQTMRIVRDCVRLYERCGADRAHPFEDVVRSLANLVSRAREKQSDLEWLASFLAQLSTHVNAAQGEPLVALVAELDGRVVGCLATSIMHVLHRPRPVGRISMMVVEEGLRSQGIGAELVRAAEAWLKQQGCGMIEVTSNVKRTDAHRFYERLGYERTSWRFAIDSEQR